MKAVVMGGTAGVGLAVAKRFAENGYEVTATGRDPDRLREAAAHVHAAEQVDGTDLDAVGSFLDTIGAIDHLVLAFSPGAVGAGPLAALDVNDVRAAIEGKLIPYLFAMKRAQVSESITLISAASARAAMAGTIGLAAVNGAIERLVSPAAAELAPVRVNAVAPGVVDTAWWSFLDEDAKRDQFEELSEAVPAGRVGQPGDVAEAVLYLSRASFVTGSVLPVDGGMTVA